MISRKKTPCFGAGSPSVAAQKMRRNNSARLFFAVLCGASIFDSALASPSRTTLSERRGQRPSSAPQIHPQAEDGELPSALRGGQIGDSLFESAPLDRRNLDAAESAAEPVVFLNGREQPRAGRWKAAPHVDVKVTYDDNIFIQPTHRVADVFFTLSPGLSFGFWDNEQRLENFLERGRKASTILRDEGNFLLVDYTPSFVIFSDNSSEDSFDQDALFDAQWQVAKLTLGARVHFESRREADIDVGERIRRKTVESELTASYLLTGKTSVEVDFYNTIEDRGNFLQTVEWRNEDYLNYRVTPVFQVSFGLAFGNLEVRDSHNQQFERILARGSYSITEKLNVETRAGIEFRQSSAEAGDQTNPIFDFQVAYEPDAETRIDFDAYRRVETSTSEPDRNITALGVSLKLSRRIYHGLRASVEGGYRFSDYTAGRNSLARSDHYFYIRPGLLYNFASWGSAELSYLYRENDSTQDSSTFSNNQVEFGVSLIF